MERETSNMGPIEESLAPQVMSYLTDLLRDFDGARPTFDKRGERTEASSLDQVLAILASRRFTHLSRQQSLGHLLRMRAPLLADMAAGRPLRFAYDLGPGYHASVRPDFGALCFVPGLGELLALRQIALFNQAVSAVYAPGVDFSLVIDDLCAWASNGIALELTASYVQRLQALVAAVGLHRKVCVLAESAVVSKTDYGCAVDRTPLLAWTGAVTAADQENVSRFVGRACSVSEASEYLARYQRAQAVSDSLMAKHLPGVRLTQRSTAQCLGFRCFAGSDVRLQTGEVDLLMTERESASGTGTGRFRPCLITSRNAAQHRRWPLQLLHLPVDWPLPMGAVHVAFRMKSVNMELNYVN